LNNQKEKSPHTIDVSTTTRCIWVTLEASEVIELKRIAMDRDVDSAISFFYDVLTPRVRTAALQRKVGLEMLVEDKNNEHISG
jgi:hypothetical protein